MQRTDETVERKLQQLRERYGQQLGEKVSRIEYTWIRLERDPGDGAGWEEFHQLTHSLAGSSATFGFAAIGELARALEVSSGEILDGGRPTTDEPYARIRELVAQLVRCAKAPETAAELSKAEPRTGQGKQRGNHTVLVIDGDRDQALALGSKINDAGYRVRVLNQPERALKAIEDEKPAAIVLSVVFPSGRDLGLQIANRIKEVHRGEIPVIFASTKQDFETRLAAARAGGTGYFAKPLEIGPLVDQLDRVIEGHLLGPYRILVVCGDGNLASAKAAALETAGMSAAIATRESDVPDQLRDFEPELVLVSHSLPSCSGLEMARFIRQHHADVGMPIVFLLPDEAATRAYLQAGLDEEDFLHASSNTDDLVVLVTHRVVRARSLRTALLHDNLSKVLEKGGDAEIARVSESDAEMPWGVATTARTRPKVLVVDDDPYILEAIAIKLGNHGMEVIQSTGGVEGYRLAYFEEPDVIVTDYNMPEGSGDYLLARLRSNPTTRDVPVVVVTGRTFGGWKDHAVERDMLGRSGAAAFLRKPLKLDALLGVVTRLTGLARV